MDDWYAGMGGFLPGHDSYLLEATWPIGDRVHEQLGSQDIVIVQARAMMLRAIEAMEAGRGVPPPSLPGTHPVVTLAAVVPDGTPGKQLWADRERALSQAGA